MKELVTKWNSISLVKRIIAGLIIGIILGMVFPQFSVIGLRTAFCWCIKGGCSDSGILSCVWCVVSA